MLCRKDFQWNVPQIDVLSEVEPNITTEPVRRKQKLKKSTK